MAYDVEKVDNEKRKKFEKLNLSDCFFVRLSKNESLYFAPLTKYDSTYNIYKDY